MDLRDFKDLFEPKVFDKIYTRFTNLSRFARLSFDWVRKSDNQIVLNVRQFEKMTDKIYDDIEVRRFIREYVDIIEHTGIKVHINIQPYESDELGNISSSWVTDKMAFHGISQRQLSKNLGVDEFVISKLLKNKSGFTRWHKAAFYFYFQSIK
ncbi:MAG: hypothetical protein WAU21_03975 [Chitinophagales bacterium]